MQQRLSATTHFTKTNKIHTSDGAQQQQQWKSYLNQQSESRQHCHDEFLQLPFDVFVSIMCGSSATVLLSNPTKLQNDICEAPLQPGKSVISETMCTDMEALYAQTMGSIEENNDATLAAFKAFVDNCRIRSQFVRNRIGNSNQPDVVPYPGLEGVRK